MLDSELQTSTVLLSSTYFLALDPKQARKRRPYPPLGTLYAAAALREGGYRVALFDAMLASGPSAFRDALDAHAPAIVIFYEDSFNYLSKMCLTRMRDAVLDMTRAARAAGATVVAAGADATDNPAHYLNAGVDFVLTGEADRTVCELVSAIVRGRGHGGNAGNAGNAGSIARIQGVVHAGEHGNGSARRPARRQPERHLDELPWPAWDLIEVDRYRRAWTEAHGHFSVNMVSTRGCPFHCNWCAKPIWGQRYAMRSPRDVARELAFVHHTLDPDHIWFVDDIFGLRPQWIEEFAAEVETLGTRLPFTIQSRVDLMTPAAVAALASAGCREVWLGVESGSQRILDAMQKGILAADVEPACNRLRAAGIHVCFFLQFGYPGETMDDIMETVELVRRVVPDDIGVSVSYPLPGTGFHERVRAELSTKTHWVDSGDLAMMFQGTYDTAFYRRLHGLVHRELEVRQALAAGNGLLADARTEAERMEQAWTELGRAEANHRSTAPTHLESLAVPSPPDLSGNWN